MRISDWSSDVCSSDLEDRSPAASATRACLRLERVEQLLDRRGAIAGDRRLIEFGLGPDVGGALAREARPRDDDLVLAILVLLLFIFGGPRGRGIGGLLGAPRCAAGADRRPRHERTSAARG